MARLDCHCAGARSPRGAGCAWHLAGPAPLIWKEDLLAAIEQRSQAEPVGLPEIESALAASEPIEYRTAFADRPVPQFRRAAFLCHLQWPERLLRLHAARTRRRPLSSSSIVVLCPTISRNLRPGPKACLKASSASPAWRAQDLRKSRPWWFRTMTKQANIYYWKDLDRMAAKCRPAGRQGLAVLP
jgi:surfeit locus 1 family protein